MKKLFALLGAILSLIYIISPIDLIPGDLTTIVGVLDDAAVVPILIACLRTLGLNLPFFGKKKEDEKDDDIIDVDPK